MRGAKRRGNLLVHASNSYNTAGDCHVGLCPPRNDRGNFNLALLIGPGGVDSTVGTPVPGCPGRTAKRRTGSKIPRHCEAEGRGNLLERRTNPTALPGDCTTGIPFGHHVGLCPPRNDNVILTWSFCFTQKKNPRFRETGGFGVLRHRAFCLRGISRADHLPFTPHQRTNCLSALPTRLSAGRGRSRRRRPASRPRPR